MNLSVLYRRDISPQERDVSPSLERTTQLSPWHGAVASTTLGHIAGWRGKWIGLRARRCRGRWCREVLGIHTHLRKTFTRAEAIHVFTDAFAKRKSPRSNDAIDDTLCVGS